MIKSADIRHKNQIKAMYERIFSDPKKFTEYYFEERMIPERVLISKDNNGKVKSMLSRNAKHLSVGKNVFKADYIYAVAVDNEYRGKGLSRDMVNKAVEIAAKEDVHFAYLIPVDERIYTGNGFVTVRKSGEIIYNGKSLSNEVKLEELNGRYYDSKAQIVKQLVEFSRLYNEEVLENNIITTHRDEEYFMTMLNQLDAEDSSFAIIRADNIIKGFAIINGHKDKEPEEIRICDYMVMPEYEIELFGKIRSRYGIDKIRFIYHTVMVKLTSPYFLKNLVAIEDKTVSIKIKDNERFYMINASAGRISVEESTKSKCAVEISLKELTECVFGMKEVKGMIEIETLEGITVNEEV